MTPTTFPFADNLANARHVRGLSTAQLADAAGLDRTTVAHYESGRRFPSAEIIIRLADVLSISTDYLLGRTEGLEAGGPEAHETMARLGQLTATDLETIQVVLDAMIERRTT